MRVSLMVLRWGEGLLISALESLCVSLGEIRCKVDWCYYIVFSCSRLGNLIYTAVCGKTSLVIAAKLRTDLIYPVLCLSQILERFRQLMRIAVGILNHNVSLE